jgi:hypothetical protein
MSFDLFENVSFKKLRALYELAKNNSRNISNIKLNYSRNYNCLQENLNFLIDIRIFKIKKNIIFVDSQTNKDFKQSIFKKLSMNDNYASLIKNYIINFSQDSNSVYSFKPQNYYNRATSDLRNFLISTQIIKEDNNRYILLDENIYTLFKKKIRSPDVLKKILEQQEKFGLEAENVVFKYEKNKLKKLDKNLSPIHISQEDVDAGYDILSYEKHKDTFKKIFIEVKGISRSDYRFYLSINESVVAEKYKEDYYLYLIPRDFSKPEKFDLSKMIKINNITKNVLANKKEWEISTSTFLIKKTNY